MTFLAQGPNVVFYFVVAAIVVVAIVFRLAAGSQDKERIDRYLRARGCEPLEITWQPFGRGFWGEKNDRIYSVHYRDPEGNHRQAWCKTNLWGGVYLSDDDIQPPRPRKSPAPLSAEAQLQQENAKLREEIERLKRGSS